MPVFQLTNQPVFPPTELAEEDGLLAVGGDLSPDRLLNAYRHGIFPWFSEGDPILWWFTSPRLVIFPENFRVSKRLARYYRKPLFKVTMDTAFSDVIETCATVRTNNNDETWISPIMKEAYDALHSMGYAHSVECWQGDHLVGGLYGLALGKVFFGESMFSLQNNASKIALVALVNYLKKNDFKIIDCQMTTDHLLSLGAEEISGSEFSNYLNKHIKTIAPDGVWNND